MPRFSICVSVYNGDRFLHGCLDSVLSQSFADFELIVVDDASSDGTADILADYAKKDERITITTKRQNEGLHLGHRAALETCSGEYVLFLDADDEFEEGLLSKIDCVLREEQDADMLHFGVRVIGEGVPGELRSSFESFVNQPVEVLEGPDILSAIFGGNGAYRQDWRMPQRVFSAQLVKTAFSKMPFQRLDCAEDAFEMFVISSLATKQMTRNDIVGLRYHLGRGLNGTSAWRRTEFASVAASFWACACQISQYADSYSAADLLASANGAQRKLMQLLFNDWRVRVVDDEKLLSIEDAASVINPSIVASEIMRCARDASYEKLKTDKGPSADFLQGWRDAAYQIVGGDSATSVAFASYLSAVDDHIRSIRKMERVSRFEDEPIRIFVSAHKSVELFDSQVFQPVQVGASRTDERFMWALRDDEGDSISDLNPMYCELTTQYWAWKNVDADYIGFCHYRRYFDFSDTSHEENAYGEVMDDYIDVVSQREYMLEDARVREVVKNYDVITTPVEDIRSYMGENSTIRSQYDAAPKLFVEDLDRVIDILVARHPEYEQDAKAFLAGHTGRFCNMFIMKKGIFRDYCAWLFPLLEEFVASADMNLYSKEGLRTPGHLAERLLNIYLLHHERIGAGWKMKQLQCVHFTKPDRYYLPMALSCGNDNRPVIPVVFASDNNYVPMVTTTIYSMLKNASDAYRYDIVVLHEGIEWENQERMKAFFGQFENAGLQFCDVSRFVDQYELTTNNPHISNETYYRFLIQELLPYYSKVLYLDSDLIVKGDVAELFSVDLGDNLLAAVRDVDYCGNLNMKDGVRMRYTKEVLGMHQPYDYFQAGVLVLNTKAMRKLHPMEKWLEFASDDRYIYNDQDILNAHCQGRVKYLDYDWNVMTDCFGRIGNVFSFAPCAIFDAFNDSRNHEKIVHYAGAQKPWKVMGCDRFDLYWEYAKDTPFYVQLSSMLHAEAVKLMIAEQAAIDDHECVVSEDSPLRRVVDPIAPFGSRRREVLKSIGRAARGLK
ncbi:DUF4422 domain-containing protein [uncultured Senegalimassilia sp.]|uniref:DUF4422 domain-containing protein n=1 Tax=uncultured Senegalimassilia sp. TaxID=1714350 RepID=UPI0025F18A65|nr:DUF4422 domain-containing protein [uncultured Senegalimassilia sp.]